MRIDNATDFGRVAVVMGGAGSEREVSLDGGRDVLEALLRREVNAFAVDGIAGLLSLISEGKVDRVFNLLHGRGGEDGALQGALACVGTPVTGSALTGCAITMDKVRSKALWAHSGLQVIRGEELDPSEDPRSCAEALGYPVVVKPVSEGSSVGVSVAVDEAQLDGAVTDARRHDRRVMLESFIDGPELTVGLLKGEPLPAIEIVPAGRFYDYQAKYQSEDTEYVCPCSLSEADELTLRETARRAFAVVGGGGWGRVDFMRDTDGTHRLLEANTTPGMTSHSLLPKAAAVAGINFDQLVWQILETSFDEVPQ
ncbi:MAG: D-alanine--D-alanine ligase [Lysobacterales bacterium]